MAYIQLVRLNLSVGIFVRDHFECVLSLGGHQFAVDCISPRGPQRCPQSIRHPLLKKCRANRQKLPQLYTTVDNSVLTVKEFQSLAEMLRWDVLLRCSAEMLYWDALLRCSAEILCWDTLLRYSAYMVCWDFRLRSSAKMLSWDFWLRCLIEKLCLDAQLRYSEMHIASCILY